MRLFRKLLWLVLFIPSIGQAQTFSTYSAIGIGDYDSKAMVQHRSMGGLGLSSPSIFYQNTLNPALLAENTVYSFAGGFTYESKQVFQGDKRDVGSGGTLSYLNMVIPIKPNIFTASLGLFPYSNVDYSFAAEIPVEGNNRAKAVSLNEGEGGFNQFALAGGAKIAKHIYLGGEIAYIFSSITKTRNVILVDPLGPYVPSSRTSLTAGDFVGGLGFSYRLPVDEGTYVAIGGTYDFATNLTVRKFQTVILETPSGAPIEIDTVQNNTKGFVKIPNSFGLGISAKRFNKWMFGTEVKLGNWDDFRDFEGINSNLANSISITVGGEIIPNISSVNNYFERITYRFGLNYRETPYLLNNTQIDEVGINFGLSLPVATLSSLDLGFQFGRRGTLDNNLIKEEYFRFYFGFTFNDNRWFVRPKFN